MSNGFTKGLVIGGIIGAAMSMVMEPGKMKNRNRKRMMRNSRDFMRKSGTLIGDVVDLFR